MKILLDTNILLDYLLNRQPFFEEANQIIHLGSYDNHFEFVSSSAVTDIFYHLNKSLKDSHVTQRRILELLHIVSVLTVSGEDILFALGLQWEDFEDAVQYAAAISNQVSVIITRNEKDFENPKIPVMTPGEFLDALKKESIEGNDVV